MLTSCDLLVQYVMIPKSKPEKRERSYGGARPNWHCKVDGANVILPYGNGCKSHPDCFSCPLPDCKCGGRD